MSYKYWYYLYYWKKHLYGRICYYCILIYSNSVFYYYVLLYHGVLLLSKLSNIFLQDIFERNCLLLTKESTTFQFLIIYNVVRPLKDRTLLGSKIIMREIVTHIYIAWIQLIFGNTLLYPVNVRYFSGPERGVFCILFVKIILRSSLLGYSMLCASD